MQQLQWLRAGDEDRSGRSDRLRDPGVDYLVWRNGHVVERINAASFGTTGARLSMATETAGPVTQHFSMSREFVGAPPDPARRVYCGNVIGVGFFDQ